MAGIETARPETVSLRGDPMLNNILVPLDGSEISQGVLPYVSQLARGLNASVILLTILDPDDVPEAARSPEGERDLRRDMYPQQPVAVAEAAPRRDVRTPYRGRMEIVEQDKAMAVLQPFVDHLEAQGVEAVARVAVGPVAETIVDFAHSNECGIIAMSTHGRNAIARGILGSVTDKVMHLSRSPVLAITPDKAAEYSEKGTTIKNIVVPLDGSELAETALDFAVNIARAMGLTVHLVRVATAGGYYGLSSYSFPAAAGMAEIDIQLENEAIDYLSNIAANLAQQGVEVEWKLLRGAPAKAIVEDAQESPRDLIVLSTHGRSGISRWLLGSVSEALVRASGDPVLVIPAKAVGHAA